MPKSFYPSAKRPWAQVVENGSTAWAVGHAFEGGRLLSGRALARRALEASLPETGFPGFLAGLSGQFALAVQVGEYLWIGSDLIRSIPLFYASDGSAASDESRLPGVDHAGLDRDSLAEFALAGFVTGSNTLLRDVRTVQAAEAVRLGPDGIRRMEYYDLRNSYGDDAEGEEVLRELDDAVMGSMERAAQVAGGRQILIPLSGGLDSRLVLASFKRLGYANLLCYSYGLQGNWESKRAGEKAARLGVEWMELPFTPEQLRSDIASPAMRAFWAFAAQDHTLPSVPDWPGMRLAAASGRVEPDAVVLSGQSGDFINGSHLKYLLDPEWHADPLDVAGAIRSKHYSLWRDLAAHPALQQRVDSRIAALLAGFSTDSPESAAMAYEFWECRERQLKYVVQGGRVFESFGHEWWMPLWDRAVIDYFKPRSIGLKLRGYLYAKYVSSIDPYGVFAENRPEARFDRERAVAREQRLRQAPRRRLKRAITALPGVRAMAERRARMREHRHYYRHNPLGFPRAYSEQEYVRRDPAKRHVLALWVRDVLAALHGVDLRSLPGLLRGEEDV